MSISSNHPKVRNLVDYGLSEKEAKAYIALLELEVASVNEVAKVAKINRSSCYVVLGSLQERGLVSISGETETLQYVASSPEILLQSAKDVAEKQREIKDRIENMLPELKALHKDTKKKPRVRVFEGKEALRQVYFDVFTVPIKEFRVYEDLTNILKIFPDFIKYDSEQREKRNINMYSISPAKKEEAEACFSYPLVNTEKLTFIPKDKYQFPVDVTIYGDRVAFASPKDLFGIIIEHKEIAEALKNGFDLAFKEAERLNERIDPRVSNSKTRT